MFKFLGKLLDSNEKEVNRLRSLVEQINALEPEAKKITDTGFAKKPPNLRSASKGGQTLDDILPESYALVREAASRAIGERHYDVQLMAAIVLHQGKVAEQKQEKGRRFLLPLRCTLMR